MCHANDSFLKIAHYYIFIISNVSILTLNTFVSSFLTPNIRDHLESIYVLWCETSYKRYFDKSLIKLNIYV